MRRTLVGIIAALALGSVSPAAFAADMVPEPAPVASWTGFYLGAGGGVGWADLDINRRHCVLDYDGFCDPDPISVATSTSQVMATSSASCKAASIGSSEDRLRRRSRC